MMWLRSIYMRLGAGLIVEKIAHNLAQGSHLCLRQRLSCLPLPLLHLLHQLNCLAPPLLHLLLLLPRSRRLGRGCRCPGLCLGHLTGGCTQPFCAWVGGQMVGWWQTVPIE